MAIEVLMGTASHVEHGTEHTLTSDGRSSVTGHSWTLRIDNHPTVMKFRESVSLGNGDDVTVAGEDKNGMFRAYALRNESTGVTHNGRAGFMKMSGYALVLIGVPLLFIFIGLFFVGAGIWAVWMGGKQAAANQALSAVPSRFATANVGRGR